MNHHPLERILKTVDGPAQAALALGQRSWLASFGLLVTGGVLVTLLSGVAASLPYVLSGRFVLPLMPELWSFFEALLLVVPSALIVAVYARIEVPVRVWVAAVAIGLMTASVVLLSGLPLVGYLTLVSRVGVELPFDVVFPMVALGAIGATIARIVRALDPSPVARWVIRATIGAMWIAFLVKNPVIQSFLRACLGL